MSVEKKYLFMFTFEGNNYISGISAYIHVLYDVTKPCTDKL